MERSRRLWRGVNHGAWRVAAGLVGFLVMMMVIMESRRGGGGGELPLGRIGHTRKSVGDAAIALATASCPLALGLVLVALLAGSLSTLPQSTGLGELFRGLHTTNFVCQARRHSQQLLATAQKNGGNKDLL